MMDDAQIKANIAARKAADALFSLAASEAPTYTQDPDIAFWGQLIKRIRAEVPGFFILRNRKSKPTCEVVRDQPMEHGEAKAFELRTMPFGLHADKRIADVPIDYLLWLDGQDEFRREVNRYLRSERGQARQED